MTNVVGAYLRLVFAAGKHYVGLSYGDVAFHMHICRGSSLGKRAPCRGLHNHGLLVESADVCI